VKPTQSYTYKFFLRWLTPDGEPPPEAAAQFHEYGRHYNNRIEIARASRTAYREARSALVPEYAAAEQALKDAIVALDAVQTEVQAHKAATRKRAIPPELRGRLEAARTAKTEAKRAFAAAKEAAKVSEPLTAKAAEIGAERNGREKAIRAATPRRARLASERPALLGPPAPRARIRPCPALRSPGALSSSAFWPPATVSARRLRPGVRPGHARTRASASRRRSSHS
jgi:hypothetical protein